MAGDHTHTTDVALASLVLYAADLPRTSAFYGTLGLRLSDEQHDGGPVHAVTRLGDVHFAVYQSEGGARATGGHPGWQRPGSSLPGVWVTSLDRTTAALRDDHHPILLEHQMRSWGCRIVAEDPDGRTVEVNQRDHCPQVEDAT